MTDFERKREILLTIESSGKVFVKALSSEMGVSEITIRRDLKNLENEGLIKRFHGGAFWKDRSFNFPVKNQKNTPSKRAIAKMASEEVKVNDVIFLDCGSTISHMCDFIKNIEGLRVITNSIPILMKLESSSKVHVNLIGGEYDPERRAIHGDQARMHIAQYTADKAFIGADGISLKKGVSSQSEVERSNSVAMSSQARETIVLCDSSKFENDAYVSMTDWKSVSALFTDDKLDPPLLQTYLEAGVPLKIAPMK